MRRAPLSLSARILTGLAPLLALVVFIVTFFALDFWRAALLYPVAATDDDKAAVVADRGPFTCGSSLARASARGVAFIDAWEPARFNASFAPALLDAELAEGVDAACSKRLFVNYSFAAHGLGSNFMVLADYILYSHLRKEMPLITIVLAGSAHAKDNPLQHELVAFGTFFHERSTMLPSLDDDVCGGHCLEPVIRGVKFWKLVMSGLTRTFVTRKPWFHQARAHLWRHFLRLKPAMRLMLDLNVDTVLDGAVPPMLAIHIRRSDKTRPGSESPYVNTSEYIQAARTIGGVRFRTVITVSDDEPAGAQVQAEWARLYGDADPPVFISRYSDPNRMRPDRMSRKEPKRARDAFLMLLTDLRLMVQADYFVGSMNSNLALMACALAGNYARCRNMDNAGGRFAWREADIKMI